MNMIYNESMCNNYASYMKTKRSKTKVTNETTVRDIVRDEMQKSIARERQMMNAESIMERNKYFKTAKQKLMLDLVKPSINIMIKDTLGQGIASQIVKSIFKKF
jgi:hypothetical protein